MAQLEKLLITSRGELALRVMRSARARGLGTVAVYSDADADAPHVHFADEAVRLGPSPIAESYLRVDALLRAAQLTGADAVHPGYGFLAENPDFAQAVLEAGLTFVGPTPAAIRAMGLKREARALVEKLGVPVAPGFDGGDQSTSTLRAQALELGLPVVFKPSAGGGGRGLRVVGQADELEAAIEAARHEARGAFGDPTLIVEKYLLRPRHVEIQVLGDHHGHLVHLFERECSIQRRHQKLIEETPSMAIGAQTREAMGRAALEVARAIGYTNAGTVEFLLDQEGRFFFSEMNTRLQVEHRVTELVVGVDLVELQLRVAGGEPLPFTQAELHQRGHAVECRLYAEDPANHFLPCTGVVRDWHVPVLGGVLVDAGIESGSTVSVHSDPLLAKLVSHGDDRAGATAKLARALDGLSLAGMTSNVGLLTRLLRHPDYLAGRLHTGFLDERPELCAEPVDAARDDEAAIAATLAAHQRRRRADDFLPQVPTGWRNNRWADQHVEYTARRVEYRSLGENRFLVRLEGAEATWRVVSSASSTPELVLESPLGVRRRFRVVEADGRHWVHGPRGRAVLEETPRFPAPIDPVLQGGLLAPMPGQVTRVLVREGEAVKKGQVLLVLEAMKLEQTVVSPADAVVRQLLVRAGEQVTAGQVLALVADADGS
jgi:acetyl/propionyl-CoA carboxylase alpha subunit